MKEIIWVNLRGNWVELSALDKIDGDPAYDWLNAADLSAKNEFITVTHGDEEFLIYRSCLQLQFSQIN